MPRPSRSCQVLEIEKEVLGEKHPSYANSLNNLAGLYKSQRDYAKAEPLYRQALEINKQVLGEKHPDYANSLNNLAALYRFHGDYAKAEPLFRQVLEIEKEVLGEMHPSYATSLGNLAALYQFQGDCAKAEPLFRQSLDIHMAIMRDSFAALGERQRIVLQYRHRGTLDLYLSVAPAAAIEGDALYGQVLAWKGAVMARQAEDRLAHDQPEVKDLLARLNRTRSRLAGLAFAAPSPKQRAAWLRQFKELRTEKENLESDLARASKGFHLVQERQHLMPAEVAAALPPGTVLVDFLEYTHFSPPKQGKGGAQRERRLLAFVLRRDAKLACVSLQAAGPVGDAVRAWRQAMVMRNLKKMETAAQDMHQLVWKPLQPHLGEAKTVLIAPDGILTVFPFVALPGQRPGSYLLEDLAIGYVTSGRHVVEIFTDPAPRESTGLLTVGGVDYGAVSDIKPADRAAGIQIAAKERVIFPPLPGTDIEARRGRDLFEKAFPKDSATLLTGAEAHKGRVKEECGKGRRYLHLATHGFFESPARIALLRAGVQEVGMEELAWSSQQDDETALAPLLRSGLVLAGANRTSRAEEPAGDDGILTAEEVAALDLRGMELVVLSACDTALGKLQAGEGVLGLQRAFHGAGARAVAASLWKVDDAATSVLMEEFFSNLWQKKLTRLEALRQAQLTVLNHPEQVAERKKEMRVELAKHGQDLQSFELPDGGKVQNRSHPAWWAAFVLSGDGR